MDHSFKSDSLSRLEEIEKQLTATLTELKEIKRKENEKIIGELTSVSQKMEFNSMYNVLLDTKDKLQHFIKGMIELSDERVIALALMASGYAGQTDSWGITMQGSVESISEDALSAALEPFTNPRRIEVLKLLIEEPLTPNEIAQKTGLIGGQLYHHLSSLEKAGLIKKADGKYHADEYALSILTNLYLTISRLKAANDYSEDQPDIDDASESNDGKINWDELIEDAIKFLSGEERASVSIIQRRYKIGYNNARRLLALLEKRGIVGPADLKTQSREVREVLINRPKL